MGGQIRRCHRTGSDGFSDQPLLPCSANAGRGQLARSRRRKYLYTLVKTPPENQGMKFTARQRCSSIWRTKLSFGHGDERCCCVVFYAGGIIPGGAEVWSSRRNHDRHGQDGRPGKRGAPPPENCETLRAAYSPVLKMAKMTPTGRLSPGCKQQVKMSVIARGRGLK